MGGGHINPLDSHQLDILPCTMCALPAVSLIMVPLEICLNKLLKNITLVRSPCLGEELDYNTIQLHDFIAKCQYKCTRNVCGAKYTHYTFTPIIKHQKLQEQQTNIQVKGHSLINTREIALTSSCEQHINTASS